MVEWLNGDLSSGFSLWSFWLMLLLVVGFFHWFWYKIAVSTAATLDIELC